MAGLIIEPGAQSSILPDPYTVATLPPAAANLRKYAWASDLFGGPGDYCISDGVSWKPVRPLALSKIANGNQNMTFTPLVDAPTQVLQGTLTGNRTMTLSSTYAYSGAKFRIKREAGGLFSVIMGVLGTVIGTNAWADFEYDGTNWVQTASGGLL